MVTVRTAKSKGSQMEYDCQASLEVLYPDIYRTSERGFQLQYDLRTDKDKFVFECKRLRGISWNQLVKFYEKLKLVKPEGYGCCVLFKSNRQPCLVFDGACIRTFQKVFGVEFIKHESTRRNKENGR